MFEAFEILVTDYNRSIVEEVVDKFMEEASYGNLES